VVVSASVGDILVALSPANRALDHGVNAPLSRGPFAEVPYIGAKAPIWEKKKKSHLVAF
jgi:hypothetical protein